MAWFSQNWIWVLFFVGMIAIHIFSHGGHGGHNSSHDNSEPSSKDGVQTPSEKESGHQH